MNFFTDDSLKYYRLGEFVAHNMLNGIIHPDMQLDNIGSGDNEPFIFKDFADTIQINIPDCLSADICDQLTQTLVPIIEDINDSFSKVSSFRMGFIALGGLLGRAIFFNTLNLGISSSWYTKNKFSASSYNPSFLYSDADSKLQIRNWKKLPLNQIAVEEYHTLYEYEHSEVRSRISDANRYYLDILYYIRGYTWWGNCLQTIIPSEDSIEQSNPIFAYNVFSMNLSCNYYIERMAKTALYYKHYCTAYGLFNKCLSAAHTVEEIRKASQDGLLSISKNTHISSSICAFIIENIDLELFEFLWILDDLDQNSTISA